MDNIVMFFVGMLTGVFLMYMVVELVDLEKHGAIAAYKGEVVCVQLAFKQERWECGKP